MGLIVRQAPYAQRSARAQLDVALAAAVLELPLEIYFLGEGVWQLVTKRETATAALPRGLKGWAALSEMTSVRFYTDPKCHARLREAGIETLVPLEALEVRAMAERWRGCRRLIAL
jgi:sulfur relay (sulfurtransferase) DsrF/TusC family protein